MPFRQKAEFCVAWLISVQGEMPAMSHSFGANLPQIVRTSAGKQFSDTLRKPECGNGAGLAGRNSDFLRDNIDIEGRERRAWGTDLCICSEIYGIAWNRTGEGCGAYMEKAGEDYCRWERISFIYSSLASRVSNGNMISLWHRKGLAMRHTIPFRFCQSIGWQCWILNRLRYCMGAMGQGRPLPLM